jgi:folate-binding protein YgfZ
MKQRVLLKGTQGLNLLHRISSINLHSLVLGCRTPGLILNPEGKILSSFEITLLTSDSAEIMADEPFLTELERYTFSEKYELESFQLNSEIKEDEEARILGLIPKEGFEFFPDGKTNPLEINLRHAIADQKGCYPGQEVIEKIISLGSPARRLCLLKSKTPTQEAPPISLQSPEGQEVGTLTSVSGTLALAIIRRTHLKLGTLLHSPQGQWEILKVSP